MWVQSFEPGSLKYMKSKGLKTRLVQLIDGDGVNPKTGAVTFAVPSDRPYDWTRAGDKRHFDAMVTPAGLAEIKSYADGIGPWKRYIISIKGTVGPDGKAVDVNKDGKIDDADLVSMAPTTLVTDAQYRGGLFVHPFTFRNESRRLAADYERDPRKEYAAFYRAGVDGVFTDFTDTALAAPRGLARHGAALAHVRPGRCRAAPAAVGDARKAARGGVQFVGPPPCDAGFRQLARRLTGTSVPRPGSFASWTARRAARSADP